MTARPFHRSLARRSLDPGGDLAVLHDGGDLVIATEPQEMICAWGKDALSALDGLRSGWWAGWLSYDLGRAVERVPEFTDPEKSLPDLCLVRFGRRRPLDSAELGSSPPGPIRRRALNWRSSLDPPAWQEAIGRILGHLRDGDCYQVNLTRRLVAAAEVDAMGLFLSLLAVHPAPHAGFVRLDGTTVVSASPERFLRRDGTLIETRPIKGTAPDAETLSSSQKDRAENVMIVDLARNDLGRVCAYGSVEVPSLCAVEAHPGLYHLVSTVKGSLRPDVTPGDIVRATFPPASVTGCPKPRVLEIIESLEPVRRGVYCGAVGFIDADNDRMDLNVAIRTFTITGGRIAFGVGGGIVADSDARKEWEETELKSRRLLELAESAVLDL